MSRIVLGRRRPGEKDPRQLSHREEMARLVPWADGPGCVCASAPAQSLPPSPRLPLPPRPPRTEDGGVAQGQPRAGPRRRQRRQRWGPPGAALDSPAHAQRPPWGGVGSLQPGRSPHSPFPRQQQTSFSAYRYLQVTGFLARRTRWVRTRRSVSCGAGWAPGPCPSRCSRRGAGAGTSPGDRGVPTLLPRTLSATGHPQPLPLARRAPALVPRCPPPQPGVPDGRGGRGCVLRRGAGQGRAGRSGTRRGARGGEGVRAPLKALRGSSPSHSLPWWKVDELRQRSANYAGAREISCSLPAVVVRRGTEIKKKNSFMV